MSSREVGALAPTCTAYAKKGFSSEELVSVNQNFQTVLAQFPVSPFERSRWRDGRFACYAPYVMLQGRAFNCDFRFPLIFLSQAKSIGCKRKKIQFP
jgi:hypothetical protein